MGPDEKSTLFATSTNNPGSSRSTTMALNDKTEKISEKYQEKEYKMLAIPTFKNFGQIEIPICYITGNPIVARVTNSISTTATFQISCQSWKINSNFFDGQFESTRLGFEL